MTYRKLLSLVCIGVVLNFLLLQFSDVLDALGAFFALFVPLLLGISIAFIINIPMSFFEKLYAKGIKKKKMLRSLSLASALIAIFTVLVILLRLVLPQFAENIASLQDTLPHAYNNIMSWAQQNEAYLPFDLTALVNNLDWTQVGEAVYDFLESNFQNLVDGTFSAIGGVVSSVVNGVLGLILALYFLSDKEKIFSLLRRMLALYFSRWNDRLLHLFSVIDRVFRNFITGQCIEASILGILCTVGMGLFGLPYATMLGALVGLTSMIPLVGGFIGIGLGALLILMVNPTDALIFVIFVVVLQQLEGNLIYPYVVGDRVGIPPVCVLLSITIGASLGGLLGVVLAVPTFGVLFVLLKENMLKKEGEKTPKEPAQELP